MFGVFLRRSYGRLARRNVAFGGVAAFTAASASAVALGMIGHPEPSLCKAATSAVDWYKVRAKRPRRACRRARRPQHGARARNGWTAGHT